MKNWENDILGSGVLYSCHSARVTINDGRSTCWYDFRSVFSDGESIERYGINICQLGTDTIN